MARATASSPPDAIAARACRSDASRAAAPSAAAAEAYVVSTRPAPHAECVVGLKLERLRRQRKCRVDPSGMTLSDVGTAPEAQGGVRLQILGAPSADALDLEAAQAWLDRAHQAARDVVLKVREDVDDLALMTFCPDFRHARGFGQPR